MVRRSKEEREKERGVLREVHDLSNRPTIREIREKIVTVLHTDKEKLAEILAANEALYFHPQNSPNATPYSIDMSRCFNGQDLLWLAPMYTNLIDSLYLPKEGKENGITLYGPAYKSLGFLSTVSLFLEHIKKIPTNFIYDRKEGSQELVGYISSSRPIFILDDVLATGKTKTVVVGKLLQQCPNADIIGIVVAVDREEAREYGTAEGLPAIKCGEHVIPVYAIGMISTIMRGLYTRASKVLVKKDGHESREKMDEQLYKVFTDYFEHRPQGFQNT